MLLRTDAFCYVSVFLETPPPPSSPPLYSSPTSNVFRRQRPPRRPHAAPRSGSRPPQGLPDRETLLAFIRESGEADRSDIARAFGLRGSDRIALRDMLRDLQDSGELGRRGRTGVALPGDLPPVGVVDGVEREADGEVMVRPV